MDRRRCEQAAGTDARDGHAPGPAWRASGDGAPAWTLRPFEARAAAARLDIDLAKAERRPDWSAEFAFAKRGPNYSDMVSLEFRIGLPVNASNRQDPVVASKSAELRQIEADREAEVRMHLTELHERLIAWEVLGEQVELYIRGLLPLSRERSHAALAAYRAGSADLAPALAAIEQEAEARIETPPFSTSVAAPGPSCASSYRCQRTRRCSHESWSGLRDRSEHRGRRRARVFHRAAAAFARRAACERCVVLEAARVGAQKGERRILYWHDPMVPGPKFDKPGKSPFMDMELVPVYADEEQAERRSAPVRPWHPEPRHSHWQGRDGAAHDRSFPRSAASLSTRRDRRRAGSRRRLRRRASTSGAARRSVQAGSRSPTSSRPTWLAAQEEYLRAARRESDAARCDSRRRRQRMRSGHDRQQIRAVESEALSAPTTTLVAPIDGVVGELAVREGSAFTAGAPLFRMNGLETVWVNAEVPESAGPMSPGGSAGRGARDCAGPGREVQGTRARDPARGRSQTRTLKCASSRR